MCCYPMWDAPGGSAILRSNPVSWYDPIVTEKELGSDDQPPGFGDTLLMEGITIHGSRGLP